VSITAYCTGLLLACRHLKKFELDEDYPGNETVCNLIRFFYAFICFEFLHNCLEFKGRVRC